MGEVGKRLYDAACGLGLEGIMAKRGDAPCRASRSKDWIKIRTPHGRHMQEERTGRLVRVVLAMSLDDPVRS